MGHFRLTPESTDIYTAHITFEDGSEKAYPLPKAKATGYVLSVSNTDTADLKIKISTTETAKPDEKLPLLLKPTGRYTLYQKINLLQKPLMQVSLKNVSLPVYFS
jgi:hypothetical protein